MARLDPLIRYRRHQLDARQRALADLLRQIEMMEAQKKMLLETLEREEALAYADDADLGMREWFSHYAASVQERLATLDTNMRRMMSRIDIARDDVREAFNELKKVEITERTRKERDEKKKRLQESSELDDIAIERFARSKDSGTE